MDVNSSRQMKVIKKWKNVTDSDIMLQEMNDDKAYTMIPVIVVMATLMVMGIIGNTMVCYYYGRKARQSSNTVFIVVVAIYDLILCSLSIPIEIVDLRFFYNFTNIGACKVMRFINYFGAIGSIYTLMVIAADRYRKICKPFKTQIGPRGAKLASGISILVAVIFSWPAILFYDAVPVEIQAEDGIILNGSDCTTTRDPSYKIYLWIFNGIYLVCFIISSVVLCVMYGLVGRVLYRHSKKRRRLSTLNSNSTSSGTDTQLTRIDEDKEFKPTYKYIGDPSSRVEGKIRGSMIYFEATPETRDRANSQSETTDKTRPRTNSLNHLDLKTVKYTMMMLVITLVFVVSFLPHLILSIWRIIINTYEGESLTTAELIAFQLGLRTYFLNSVINPFTYGFFNPKFKLFFKMTFCPCFIKDREKKNISSSTEAT